MRCFISLDLSLECREEIKKIQDLIRKKNLFLGKFTEFENLHLTQDDIYSFLENKGYSIVKKWGYMGWTSFAKKI